MPHPFINGRGASRRKIRRVRPDAKALDRAKKEQPPSAAPEVPEPSTPPVSTPQPDPTPVAEAVVEATPEPEPAPEADGEDALRGQPEDLLAIDEAANFVEPEPVEEPSTEEDPDAPEVGADAPDPSSASEAELDFSVLDGGIKALEQALEAGEWDAHLDALLKAEEGNKNRKGAKSRIADRQGLLAEAE